MTIHISGRAIAGVVLTVAAVALAINFVTAATPGIISYQGRVLVNGAPPPDGMKQFKFALVNSAGTATFWRHDTGGTVHATPANTISVQVTSGLYSVLLGDASITNMTAIPSSVFENADVRLRIWFNDGVNGELMLTPDQRIAAVGYAQIARAVDDGSITTVKLADGAVTAIKTADFPKCQVFHVSDQNVPNAAVQTINFDSERYDNDAIHDPGTPSRLTCKTAGTYHIVANLTINCGSSGYTNVLINVNGGTVSADFRPGSPIGAVQCSSSAQVFLNVGDYVEIQVSNQTGQAASVRALSAYSPNFMMSRLP